MPHMNAYDRRSLRKKEVEWIAEAETRKVEVMSAGAACKVISTPGWEGGNLWSLILVFLFRTTIARILYDAVIDRSWAHFYHHHHHYHRHHCRRRHHHRRRCHDCHSWADTFEQRPSMQLCELWSVWKACISQSCQGTVSAHMTRVGRIGTHCNKLLFQIRYFKISPPDIFCPLDKTRCNGERFLWCRPGFTNGTGRWETEHSNLIRIKNDGRIMQSIYSIAHAHVDDLEWCKVTVAWQRKTISFELSRQPYKQAISMLGLILFYMTLILKTCMWLDHLCYDLTFCFNAYLDSVKH